MLTLKQLYDKTDELRIRNAKYVKFLKVKKGRNLQGLGFIAVQSHSLKTVDNNGHQVRGPSSSKYLSMVTFLDNKLHCTCSCSCDDFLYRWEVALNKKGAAEIEYSNGKFPNTTNPALQTHLCKHLVAIYLRIQNHIT